MSMTSDYGLVPHNPGNHYAYNNEAVQFYGCTMDAEFFGSKGPVAVLQQVFWGSTGREDNVSFHGYWGGWSGGFDIPSEATPPPCASVSSVRRSHLSGHST